jgi:hypothetical protein
MINELAPNLWKLVKPRVSNVRTIVHTSITILGRVLQMHLSIQVILD